MRCMKILIVVACVAAPAPLLARQVPTDIAAAAAVGHARSDDKEGGNPRLELLGLLGLAGLLGLLRPEPNIHVDARRKPRP